MARYAIVKAGRVDNIIEADAAFAASLQGAVALDVGTLCGPGWTHSGGQVFTAPAAPVPASVTMRQARLALLAAGKLAAVSTAIAGLPEPQKSAATIEWEYSNEVQRSNGFVEQLGPALGLTAAQLDALFIAAAAL